jgi:hypothetical protein
MTLKVPSLELTWVPPIRKYFAGWESLFPGALSTLISLAAVPSCLFALKAAGGGTARAESVAFSVEGARFS